MKVYLKAQVKGGDPNFSDSVAVEFFRLDAADESGGLTTEEAEAAAEGEVEPTTTAVMRIYEDIGEDPFGAGLSEKKFAKELDAFGDIRRLNIHINSLGGCAFTAHAIHNIIQAHPAPSKTAYIDGVAASAATIIACGAGEVVARANTTYMIHEPWTSFVQGGNAKMLRQAADILDKLTVPIIRVYKDQVKGKTSEEQIRQMMEDETWMTADEAFEYGFVDRVRGKISAIARVNAGQILCSGRLMNLAKYHYRNAPKYPLVKRLPAAAAEQKPQLKEENKPMNIQDIAPELRAQIEGEARAAERARLTALDALDGPGLEDIIAKAKTEGKQPNDIALECLAVTKQQVGALQKTSALARDAAAARAVPAGDAPSGRVAEKREAKNAALLVSAFKSQKPRGLANGAAANGHRN